jgi:gamma-glutamylcyclotransferase (GGCT)/AIG2-like uncharacterized protein YtfP
VNAFLFVYGTLRPGQRAAHRLGVIRSVTPGTIRGRLYHLPAEGYPVVIDGPEGIVHGERVEIDEAQLPSLDDYEGPLYRRVIVTVEGPGGSRATAWCWQADPAQEASVIAKGAIHLPGGRWPVDGA